MNLRTPLLVTCLAVAASGAAAQVSINQTKALAGNVTAGDTPGFPVTITQPGSYRLTSDLVVPMGSAGVVIQGGLVTLDLNGFSIRSENHCSYHAATQMLECPSVTSPTTAHGVRTTNNLTVIRNGRIHGFPGHGILGLGGERLEDLMVYQNGGYGYVGFSQFEPSPRPGHITGSRFFSNRHTGAFVRNTLIERSQFSFNTYGLRAYGGTIIDSMIVGNKAHGLQASDATWLTTIKGTTWHGNGGAAVQGAIQSLGGNFDGSALF